MSTTMNFKRLFLVIAVCAGSFVNVSMAQDKSPATNTAQTPASQNPGQANAAQADAAAIEKSTQQIIKTMTLWLPKGYDFKSESGKSYRAAIVAQLTGNLDQVESNLNSAIELEPELPPANFLKSILLDVTGQSNQSRAVLDTMAVENPKDPLPFLAFGQVAIARGRIADALALLHYSEELIESGTFSAVRKELLRNRLLSGQAELALINKQYAVAVAKLTELSKIAVDKENVLFRLAEAEFKKGELETSSKLLQSLYAKNDTLPVPELAIAIWFRMDQKNKEASEWFQKAVTNYPKNPKTHEEQSRNFLLDSQLEKAYVAAEESENVGGERVEIDYLKGQIAFSQENYRLAEVHFDKINKTNPGNFEISNLLALSMVENGSKAKLQTALTLASANAGRSDVPRIQALATLGWVYYRMGNQKNADQVFNQISRGNFDSVTGYFLSAILIERQRYVDASRLLDKIVISDGSFIYLSKAKALKKKLEASLKSSAADPKKK